MCGAAPEMIHVLRGSDRSAENEKRRRVSCCDDRIGESGGWIWPIQSQCMHPARRSIQKPQIASERRLITRNKRPYCFLVGGGRGKNFTLTRRCVQKMHCFINAFAHIESALNPARRMQSGRKISTWVSDVPICSGFHPELSVCSRTRCDVRMNLYIYFHFSRLQEVHNGLRLHLIHCERDSRGSQVHFYSWARSEKSFCTRVQSLAVRQA